MSEHKICVYAMCKNESKFVKKWLDSMQEADYIVVLDTGSTDDTVKLLKEDKRVTKVKTKKITPWRFDVARNESMKLVPADADILVCTDFDEVFEPGWADVIRNNWKDDTTRIYYTYAWSHNDLGEPQDVFKYDKIHTKDYHWIFPVHEVLAVNDDTEEHFVDVGESIYLHHFPDKSKQRSYYFDLLELSVKENPDDSHVRMLYAREFLVKGETERGIEEYTKVLQMPDVNKPEKRAVLLHSLLHMALAYQVLENYDEGLWYCQEFIKEDYTYREPYLLMAEMYNTMHMYSLAESCVKAALEYSYQKFNWVEKANSWIAWPNDVLSVSQFYLGKIDEAIENGNIALKHEPNNVRILKNVNAFMQKKIELNNEKLNKLEQKDSV